MIIPATEYDEAVNYWTKVIPREGCWGWLGHKSRGYGQLSNRGKTVSAHRLAYQLMVGPITDGQVVHHICKNHECSNPEHLTAVTQRDNLLAGTGISAKYARVTHCPKGHAYDLFNTYYEPKSGARSCLICRRQSALDSYRRGGKKS